MVGWHHPVNGHEFEQAPEVDDEHGSLACCCPWGHKQSDTISALLTMPKPLTVWITVNWKILKEMGIPDHLICLLRNLYADQEATVRTGHGTTDWFKQEREYVKAIYCHPVYLTYMQSTS